MLRTLPIHFSCREIRASKCFLVVTKVTGCGDLLFAGGEPNQHGGVIIENRSVFDQNSERIYSLRRVGPVFVGSYLSK